VSVGTALAYPSLVTCRIDSAQNGDGEFEEDVGPMSLTKPAIFALAAAGFFGVSVPAWSQPASASQASADVPAPYDAEVMPTPDQVQLELTAVGNRLRQDEQSSFYSPVAESDYLEAQRQFAFGQYDRASQDAEAAAASLPDIPNWKTAALAPHEN
jgi:hypothetical protein